MALTIPYLTDVYLKDEGCAYVWFHLYQDGTGLEIEEIGEDNQGDLSPSLEYEVENLGWADMLDFPSHWEPAQLTWALEDGIAPEQPFLIRFDPPDYYSCGEYGEEQDVTYEWDLVYVEPWLREKSLSVWEKFLQERDVLIEYKQECIDRLRKAQRTRIDHMHLRPITYSRHNYGIGASVRLELISDYQLTTSLWDHLRGLIPYNNLHSVLVSGTSESGDREEALKALVKEAKKTLPHLSEDVIRGLPQKRLPGF